MNTALWIAQAMLAARFCGSAFAKGTWPYERFIASGQTGVRGLPIPFIRFIAFSELLGALGLILPGATGKAPWLTPVAAAGLSLIMVGAAFVHTRLREPKNVLVNVVVLFTCVFVIVGRAGMR